MLIHIVCWKYKPEVMEEQRDDHRRRLLQLKNVIPQIIDLRVGENGLHLERSYDMGLVGIFKDWEDLDIYTQNPIHQQVANLGKQLADHVVSVDFESE